MNNQQLVRRDVIIGSLTMISNQVNSLMMKDKQKADRFLAASLVVASDKNLDNCDPSSIAQCLLGIAMLNLNVDKNIGHAYLVPHKGIARLQVGYKGLIQLMYRAGWMCKALPVYLCDEFSMSFDGWDNKVKFIPNLDERDEGDKDWVVDNLRGIYVVARHGDSKDEYSTFVNKAVIEKLRLISPNQSRTSSYASNEDNRLCAEKKPLGIWRDWYAEMAMAKAIKKLAKVLPIGDRRIETIIAVEDKMEMGNPVDIVKSIEAEYIIERETVDQPKVQELPELTDEDFKEKQLPWFNAVISGKKSSQQILIMLKTKYSITEDQENLIYSWSQK